MNDIIPFEFQGAAIRTITKDGEPWFVAKDVAEVLGYEKPENAIARHCKAATTTPKQGGGFLTLISERDVYRLVMRSKLPSAEKFEAWVVGEVLPSIRKTGAYSMETPEMQVARGLLAAQSIISQQKAEIAYLEPKAAALDRLSETDGSMCITQAAKVLKVQPKELFSFLDYNGWTYRRPGTTHRIAYQDKIQSGYLEHKATIITSTDGTERVTEQARVTAKGLAKLAVIFGKKEAA